VPSVAVSASVVGCPALPMNDLAVGAEGVGRLRVLVSTRRTRRLHGGSGVLAGFLGSFWFDGTAAVVFEAHQLEPCPGPSRGRRRPLHTPAVMAVRHIATRLTVPPSVSSGTPGQAWLNSSIERS